MLVKTLGTVCLAIFLASCGGKIQTPFKGNPAESYVAPDPYCKVNASGKYESAVSLIGEKGKTGKNYFAKGGGCIFRPLREVWAITHNQKAFKWKESDLDGDVVSKPPTSGEDFFFLANYSGEGGTEWVMEWRQKLKSGDENNPKYILIQYTKTSGTAYIQEWKGTVELKALSEDVTSFAMINEIRGNWVSSFRIKEKQAMGAVSDLFSSYSTLDPDWTWLEGP